MDRRGLGEKDGCAAQEKEGQSELTRVQREQRFNELIGPHYEFIRKLVSYYTDRPQNVDENYNTLLLDFYRYIHTYNGNKPLKTWIHSVVKNNVWTINKERANRAAKIADAEYSPVERSGGDNSIDLENGLMSLPDLISDEVYSSLLLLPPMLLSVFVLQIQGYSIDEITNIEYIRGHIARPSSDIIKNRIFLARKKLREKLISHGIKRKMQ